MHSSDWHARRTSLTLRSYSNSLKPFQLPSQKDAPKASTQTRKQGVTPRRTSRMSHLYKLRIMMAQHGAQPLASLVHLIQTLSLVVVWRAYAFAQRQIKPIQIPTWYLTEQCALSDLCGANIGRTLGLEDSSGFFLMATHFQESSLKESYC